MRKHANPKPQGSDHQRSAPDCRMLFISKRWTRLPQKFSADLTEGFYDGSTVIYACIQLAIYMGFQEIILLGADHNYSVMIDLDGRFS